MKKNLIGHTALLTFALAAGAAPLAAQLGSERVVDARTIRVSGVGEIRAVPDLATLQFAVETVGATAQDASRENAQAMDRVIQALLGAGIRREDISTSGYSLYPEYAQVPRGETEPPRIRGYRASNQVGVRTTQMDRLGQLIDVGITAGANRLSGISFEVRDAQAAQAQALERAVNNARASAETIARALGVTLGPVLDASTMSDPIRPVFRAQAQAAMSMDMAAAAPTPIEPGEQTVHASASLVFQIL